MMPSNPLRHPLRTLFRALLLVVLAFTAGCTVENEEGGASTPLPPLKVPGINGGELDLASLKGKVTVLNAWAPWCPPCLEEMPSLERLHQRLDPARYRVIGITTDDRFLALEFLQKNAISFDNFYVSLSEMETILGVKTFPETLLIAADGTVVERIAGARDWASDEVHEKLEKLAAQTPLP